MTRIVTAQLRVLYIHRGVLKESTQSTSYLQPRAYLIQSGRALPEYFLFSFFLALFCFPPRNSPHRRFALTSRISSVVASTALLPLFLLPFFCFLFFPFVFFSNDSTVFWLHFPKADPVFIMIFSLSFSFHYSSVSNRYPHFPNTPSCILFLFILVPISAATYSVPFQILLFSIWLSLFKLLFNLLSNHY